MQVGEGEGEGRKRSARRATTRDEGEEQGYKGGTVATWATTAE